MHTITVNSDIEKEVILRALETYHERKAEIDSVKKAMESMESMAFPMGTVVTVEGWDTPGVVVYYDMKNDYYRVHFSENCNFVGIDEKRMSIYDGDISEELMSVKPLTEVKHLSFYLDSKIVPVKAES